MCIFVNVNEAQKVKDNFQQHFVVSNNINTLIVKIIEERSLYEENILIRIGLDGGGGFVKMCLLFDIEEKKGDAWSTKWLGEKILDCGVKKTMIIGIVPNVQENYMNIKRFWLEVGLDKLSRDFTIATDLKLANILLGLMSHSSTNPCCWCDVIKDNLLNKGEARTIAKLMDLFWNFFDARAASLWQCYPSQCICFNLH